MRIMYIYLIKYSNYNSNEFYIIPILQKANQNLERIFHPKECHNQSFTFQ